MESVMKVDNELLQKLEEQLPKGSQKIGSMSKV
jgi:hypothetical protein